MEINFIARPYPAIKSRYIVKHDVRHSRTTDARRAPRGDVESPAGAAWQLTHFASFRTASIFVKSAPSRAVLERFGFRQGARGANTWLVVPDAEPHVGTMDLDVGLQVTLPDEER